MARLAIDDAAWTNRWRPRSVAEKSVLALGLLLVAIVTTTPWIHLTILAVFLMATVAFAQIPLTAVLRALTLPVSFVVVGLVGILFTLGTPAAETVWSWGLLSLSQTSLERAIAVATRSTAAISAMLLLALTTPMSDLLRALRRLGVPAFMVEIASLVYRMLFLLLDSQAAIRESQTARLGYASRPNALRSFGGLAAAVLMRAWTRARRMESGLAGRGFAGNLTMMSASQPMSARFTSGSILIVVSLGIAAVMTR